MADVNDTNMEDASAAAAAAAPAGAASPGDHAGSSNTNLADPASAEDSSSKKKSAGPKKAKGKLEEPAEIDPNYPGQKYHVGELIYANYAEGKQWFEARVLKVEKRQDLIYYYLHYQGWSDKFNDWRPYHKDAELMKHDEEGKKVYDEAKTKMKESKAKSSKGGAAATSVETEQKKKKRKAEDDDAFDDDVQVGGTGGEVKLKISGFLKKQLIADWDAVTRQHKLVTLPRAVTVRDLLQEYEQSKAKQESSHNMCKEVVSGLEQYFEKALGTVLLYRFERPQYKEQVEKIKAANGGSPSSLSQIYGAEHLLRLFGQ
jgi:mortality factor 4-like protein 1